MRMTTYALIRDNAIEKMRNVNEEDILLVSKLTAHNYLPVEEQPIPKYDDITQSVTDSYQIQAGRVIHVWSIKENPFIDSKQLKNAVVEQITLDKIKTVFGDVEEQKKVTELLLSKDIIVTKINDARTNDDLRLINVTAVNIAGADALLL